MAVNENPGALAGAAGAVMPNHALAEGIAKVAENEPSRHRRAALYTVTPEAGEPFTFYASGREAWALDRLIAAGQKGITSIEQPAPRLSAYVHSLRRCGVVIETLTELHDGDFPGWHGRYVLRSTVRKGGAG